MANRSTSLGGKPRITEQEANEMSYANDIFRIEQFKLKTLGDNFVYHLDSKLLFGKYKENELRHIYKIDPEYIQWLILNAEGFIVDPITFNILKNEPVFNVHDILRFGMENPASNIFTFDLSQFETKPPNNFRGSQEVREEEFQFSPLAISRNEIKIHTDIDDLAIFFKGGKWGDSNAIIRIPNSQKMKIAIKP